MFYSSCFFSGSYAEISKCLEICNEKWLVAINKEDSVEEMFWKLSAKSYVLEIEKLESLGFCRQ